MAIFKVGDRARFVGGFYDPVWINRWGYLLGNECTIISIPAKDSFNNADCSIMVDGDNSRINVMYRWLEPLLKRPELGSIEELSQILGGWKPGMSKPVMKV